MKHKYFLLFIFFISLFTFAWKSFARSMLLSPLQETTALSIGFARNAPMNDSVKNLEHEQWHPTLGVRFQDQSSWTLGFQGQFIFFYDKEKQEKLALFTVSQESIYKIRLYYPYFAILGFKLKYFIPCEKGIFPLKKRVDIRNQFGTGLLLGFNKEINKKFSAQLNLERWRSVNSSSFHGLEFSTGINYKI